MEVSVIVPCYNSSEILETMIDETVKELELLNIKSYEFVLVNDCSPKAETIGFLKSICAKRSFVKLIDLAKNTGQANAQVAALNFVSGDIIINMDDDMQTHPKNIPLLYNKLNEGYDLVLGKYKKKKHSFFRRFLTWADDIFEGTFLKKPKELSFTSFWITRKYIVDEIIKYHNPYAFMEGLFLRTAGKIANVEIEHFERSVGDSGYNFFKLVSLWSNFTGFTVLPLRIAGAIGIITTIVGFIGAIIVVIKKLTNPLMPEGYASLLVVILILFGITLSFVGILGEYIGRIFMAVNNSPQFVVKEKINFEGLTKE